MPAFITKYDIVKANAVIENATDQFGLNEQNWLLVSVIKHDITKMQLNIKNIKANATIVPVLEVGLWVTLIFLEFSDCSE